MNSPAAQNVSAKGQPPQRGSFPLDHDGECVDAMKEYLSCIKRNKGNNSNEECRRLSRAYLQCRMDHNLMSQDSMTRLGFTSLEEQDKQASRDAKEREPNYQSKK